MSVTGYGLSAYGRMITCEPRMGAYAEALKRSVTPGCRVIDLGAGPGLFALLACKYGAGSVVAIEPDASIEVGRRAARDNGFADRISFVQDLSTAWQPDRKADVVISDIRGVMPLFEGHIPTICDVRERLLAPGGVLIPGSDRIKAALVEAADAYSGYSRPWAENDYGVDLSAALPFIQNSWSRVALSQEALLTEPELFARLDYGTVTETSHKAKLSWDITRPGTAHGILMWFDTDLVPGVGFSNAPGQPELVYGQAFFPLEKPVRLTEGAGAQARISADLVNGHYVWSWAFEALSEDGTEYRFRQSSFKGDILSKNRLAVRASTFRPPPGKAQEVDSQCLMLFDGQRTLEAIADELQERFPGHFSDSQAAFDHVAALSARYNR
jgi:type I protein arginine methyltransferase